MAKPKKGQLAQFMVPMVDSVDFASWSQRSRNRISKVVLRSSITVPITERRRLLPAVQSASSPATTATPLPSPTPTSIPGQAALSGIRHEYQQFNNCGPANLAMTLSFWGWQGDQRDTAAFLRPGEYDKNVMPAEMVAFVEQKTGLEALARFGGNLETIKHFIAAGFPVLIEKGYDPEHDDWMGHYLTLNAYDDAQSLFTAQDSLIMPDFPLPYQTVEERWRDFNFVYVIVYPPEREVEVSAILRSEPAREGRCRPSGATNTRRSWGSLSPRSQRESGARAV